MTECSICGASISPLIQQGRVSNLTYNDCVAAIHRCHTCDHVQFSPIPPEEVLQEHYSSVFFPLTIDQSWEQWSASKGYRSQRSFVETVLTLKSHYNKEYIPKVHDFGCGYGALVKQLCELCFNASGSDFGGVAVEQANARGLSGGR